MTVIPIVIDMLGTVTKGLVQGQEDLEIKGHGESIQTTTLLNNQNTKKSSGDLRRLAVTQTRVENHPLTLV